MQRPSVDALVRSLQGGRLLSIRAGLVSEPPASSETVNVQSNARYLIYKNWNRDPGCLLSEANTGEWLHGLAVAETGGVSLRLGEDRPSPRGEPVSESRSACAVTS